MNVPEPTCLADVDQWIERRERGVIEPSQDPTRQYSHLAPHARGWMPFEEARRFVRSLELDTAAQYRAWLRGDLPNLPAKPKGLPTNPDQAYQKFGWAGYTDYLKTPRAPIAADRKRDAGTWLTDIYAADYDLTESTVSALRAQAARLVYYYRLHGHCRVRLRDPIWKPLAKQLERLRADYNQGNDDRIEAFQAMLPDGVTPFDTSGPTPSAKYRRNYVDAWEEKCDQLEAFKTIFGHTRIPLKPWPENHSIIPLARWANQQRVRVKNGSIREYQIKRLQALGFNTHQPLQKTAPFIDPKNLERWVRATQQEQRATG